MTTRIQFNPFKRRKLSSLLGLELDGSRLEGVVLRRTNGSLRVHQTFSAVLSIDPLASDPELAGREIRNHLEAAGIRERYCVMGAPLKWALLAQTALPDLPEADVASFLQIEAERGFPCDVEGLVLATSRLKAASGAQHATMVGIARDSMLALERTLRAAQLKPVSFSLGITALQAPGAEGSDGVLALVIGQTQVGLQVTCGGGLAALRTLEGLIDAEGGRTLLHSEMVAREVRITLGQLPPEFRDAVRRIRVFGPPELARELSRELKERFEPLGLKIETASAYAPGQFGVTLPANAPVSAAFCLAAWPLAGKPSPFEFLPPKVTAWQQLAARYSSGALQKAGLAAGILLLGVLLLFGVQQWQLSRLESQFGAMESKVRELETLQARIRQFRPWFDDSLRTLSILRQLTESFPEDGMVSAKAIEIRDQGVVTCSGTARDNQAWLRTLERLRAIPSISDLKVDMIRGKTPMQFTFDFRWTDGGKHEN